MDNAVRTLLLCSLHNGLIRMHTFVAEHGHGVREFVLQKRCCINDILCLGQAVLNNPLRPDWVLGISFESRKLRSHKPKKVSDENIQRTRKHTHTHTHTTHH